MTLIPSKEIVLFINEEYMAGLRLDGSKEVLIPVSCLLTKIVELEQEAIAEAENNPLIDGLEETKQKISAWMKSMPKEIKEAEKPKLVFENGHDCIAFIANYNDNIGFGLFYDENEWEITCTFKYPPSKQLAQIELPKEKTFELAQQACEQFLKELLTPKTNE